MAKDNDKYTAILEAAVRVMADTGYHRAQVSRIAAEADVAAGTLYLYFRNKQDLLVVLFRERLGQFLSQLEDALARAATPEAAVIALVEHHFAYLGGNLALARVIQLEMRQADPDVQSALRETVRPYLRMIESVVQAGQAAGVFDPAYEPRLARRVIFGALDECVSSWALAGGRYDLKAQAPMVARLLLGGLKAGGDRS